MTKTNQKQTPSKLLTVAKSSKSKVFKSSSSSGTSSWVQKRIAAAKKTLAVIASEDEIRNGAFNDILPGGAQLTQSQEFLADLKMSGSHWFYHNSAKRVLLVQKNSDKKGAKPEQVRADWRRVGVKTCQALQSKKLDDVEVVLTAQASGDTDHIGVFQQALALTNYENVFKMHEGEKDANEPRNNKVGTTIGKISYDAEQSGSLQSDEVTFAKAATASTLLARDLASLRGGPGNPARLEAEVHKLAKGKKGVKEIRVLDAQQLQDLGMNLFWSVGKGADVPPRCVIVHYQGNPASKKVDLALCGKGVTYDTGGLHLKGYGNMEDMYGDKGGSCAVLGALKGTLDLQIKKNIIFACGFADNAIGPDAYKPGDIIKSMKGLHVEIGNTDAEGRLVLGDTMTYVQKHFKPERLIDLATLTGSSMVALGTDTASAFSNDDDLMRDLLSASKASMEPIWHMPITDEHKDAMVGKYGDLNNVGKSRYGGACTAAAFLLRFVEKDVKWCHLDIAGPCMRGTAKPPFCIDQTGFGASLILHYIANSL